jgi:hypothetical protein
MRPSINVHDRMEMGRCTSEVLVLHCNGAIFSSSRCIFGCGWMAPLLLRECLENFFNRFNGEAKRRRSFNEEAEIGNGR